MIGGQVKRTEEEYRSIEIDSSSTLALFAESRGKYYQKYILDEEVQEDDEEVKETRSLAIGSLTHTLLLNPEDFDDKYYMSSCSEKPTGLMLSFVNALLKVTDKATNEDGIICADFMDILKEAYSMVDFKRDKLETVVKKFVGTSIEDYYTESRLSKGKTVVTEEDRHIVNRIIARIHEYEPIAKIFQMEETDRYSVFNEVQGENLVIDGLPLKYMIDKIIVDHEEKIITPYDLKVTWNIERFYKGYYLKRKSFFQTYIYTSALKERRADLGFDYSGYLVEPISYIAADTMGFSNPIQYKLTETDFMSAYYGFKEGEYEYKGVKETIKDLLWAKENNMWRSGKEAFINNGVLPLK